MVRLRFDQYQVYWPGKITAKFPFYERFSDKVWVQGLGISRVIHLAIRGGKWQTGFRIY